MGQGKKTPDLWILSMKRLSAQCFTVLFLRSYIQINIGKKMDSYLKYLVENSCPPFQCVTTHNTIKYVRLKKIIFVSFWFPVFLGIAWLHDSSLCLSHIGLPSVSFPLLSFVRTIVNGPRVYLDSPG